MYVRGGLIHEAGILLSDGANHIDVLSNNHHMSRPICSGCKKRCPHKVALQCSGLISCSISCIDTKELSWVAEFL
ncbi:unnamed protein product [Arabidopsis halleri]